MCCPKYKPGPPPDQAQILATKLKDILISYVHSNQRTNEGLVLKKWIYTCRSGFVPLDSLVIAPGKLVWVVYIDIVCLSNDGNVFDASLSATTSALKSGTFLSISSTFFFLID
jgi:exosome complex component RRP43